MKNSKDAITPFGSREDERELCGQLKTLQDGRHTLTIEREALRLRRDLQRGGFSASRRASFEVRAQQLEEELLAAGKSMPQPSETDMVKLALAVLGGEVQYDPLPSEGRLAELGRLLPLVETAVTAVTGRLDVLRAERSRDLARLRQHGHHERLAAQYRAARALAEATAEERAYRTAPGLHGYDIPCDLLPAPGILSAAVLLGNEAEFNSQISHHRRFLQEHGIVD